MGIPTYMYVELPPPETVGIGEEFRFYGYLRQSDETPIENGIVELYVDGTKVDEISTDDRGGWDLWIGPWMTRGTRTIEAKFLGDATYDPCSTDLYEVYVVGSETSITVVEAPPLDVGVGEPFYICGFLASGLERLLDKTVELYVNGAKVKAERTGHETETANQGWWRFAVPAPQTLGVHTVEVRFNGDDAYEPCSSGVIEFNAIESGVVPTIEPYWIPTKVALGEYWAGTYYLCNRGTGAGSIRAVIITEGGVVSETPILSMSPGGCQKLSITGYGPTSFTIRTGV
ncbi:hypothetical protein ES703_00051 [subsurface metagenome]